jgi:hypothetical protein
MKPVPIAQYLDHIGRAAQAESQTPRRDPVVFPTRLARGLPDPEPDGPVPFSRVLLEAAIAARSRAAEERPRDASRDERAGSRGLPRALPPRPRETAAAPAADLEAAVAEAFERGLREGEAVARAEAAETRAQEQAERRRQEQLEWLEFKSNEYANLAETIETGLAEIEQRIAGAAARILAPFLNEEIAKQVVDELCAHVARLSAGGSPGLMKIRGPERLLAALRRRLSGVAVDVEFVAEEGVEATIEAQRTVIRSTMQPWADLIASLDD